MKKDLDKLLSRTLFTYFTILFVIFILKMFGLNYFQLDLNNSVINKINVFIINWHLENIWYIITLYINGVIIMSITCNDNTKTMKKYVFACLPLFILVQYLKRYSIIKHSPIFVLIDFLYLFILSMCYIKLIKRDKIRKNNVVNYFIFTIITILFQYISLLTRNVKVELTNNFIVSSLLSLDYIILSIMVYRLYFIKGGKSLWKMVHSSSLDLLISLKKLPTKLLTSYHVANPKTKQEELANKIYTIFFWLYNFFTLFVVLLIGTLNDTFIECIFILSSFWINKGVFGKAFHLKKASTCFVVSSLSYYILNRLTWKVGVSFLVPTLLGISLSYITSKFMARQENIYLYRGMPSNKFYNLIKRVTDNEQDIEICKMYYVDKQSNLKIAIKFNYSEINIKKIKAKINSKIKELQ